MTGDRRLESPGLINSPDVDGIRHRTARCRQQPRNLPNPSLDCATHRGKQVILWNIRLE